tara:strand:+ start:323 stop:535 length:213 start_codon:yes stop_codon:yes gene_type:complete
MEELENYQDYLDQAVEWAIGIIPSLITAIVIFFVGLWAITFINKMVRRFSRRRTTMKPWNPSCKVLSVLP